MKKTKILLIPDRLNWAYHSIAKSLIKFNNDPSIEMDIEQVKGNREKLKSIHKEYDKFLVMGHQTYDSISFLPKSKTLVGIHSHHQFDHRRTTPELDIDPPNHLINDLAGFRGVNFVSKRLYDLFRRNGLDDSKAYLTENGVESSVFAPGDACKREGLVVGYSGSKSHDWRKGVTEFIMPAAKKAGVKAEIAMLSTGNYVPLEEMPSFYDKIDVYICASASEGFSLSVLEAASCGKAVISTGVGGCVDLIKDEVNGYLVDRSVEAIAKKIEMLKDNDLYLSISSEMRKTIVEEYDWSVKVKEWIEFLKV